VAPARKAAEKAVTLLGRSPESLYALAFAWHCTETLEDIEIGKDVYDEILAREPKKHPAVYNNLGYILMVGGEKLRTAGRTREAERWWKEAEKHMRRTLALSDPNRRTTPFTHANLGNLHRLRGAYDLAEREYLQALGPEPEASKYTNGLNELACLYAEMGKREKADRYHELALRSADDPVQRKVLAEAMARASGG
jgi:tetratricopeptide (TPR) repeat protein